MAVRHDKTGDLWGWQDAGARRLVKEGKRELEKAYRSIGKLSPDKMGAAADLARRIEEPQWELFFRHWAVQGWLYRDPRPLGDVLTHAERVKELADAPSARGWAHKFCAHEDLWGTWLDLDGPGYAPRVAAEAAALVPRARPALDCRSCLELVRARALLGAGRVEDGEALCEKVVKAPRNDQAWFAAMLIWADAAWLAADAWAMGLLVKELGKRLAGGSGLNPDSAWGLRLREVRWRVLQGRLSAAEAAAAKKKGSPPLATESVGILLALAHGHAGAGAAQRARERAEEALGSALKRGLRRHAAEACLAAAQACAALGDESAQARFAGRLGPLVARLMTRDLDEPARAVGAALS